MTIIIVMIMTLLKGTKGIKKEGPESTNEKRVNAYCFTHIRMVELVHDRRREKRDRKIIGINIGVFLSGDRIQKFFDLKRTTKNMPSVMPFNFNAIELRVVTIRHVPGKCVSHLNITQRPLIL